MVLFPLSCVLREFIVCDVLTARLNENFYPPYASLYIRPEPFDPDLIAEGLMVEGRRGGRACAALLSRKIPHSGLEIRY
jgi:hypothetical protein